VVVLTLGPLDCPQARRLKATARRVQDADGAWRFLWSYGLEAGGLCM